MQVFFHLQVSSLSKIKNLKSSDKKYLCFLYFELQKHYFSITILSLKQSLELHILSLLQGGQGEEIVT